MPTSTENTVQHNAARARSGRRRRHGARAAAAASVAALAAVAGVVNTGQLDPNVALPRVEAAAMTMTSALLPRGMRATPDPHPANTADAAPSSVTQPAASAAAAGLRAQDYTTVKAAAIPGLTKPATAPTSASATATGSATATPASAAPATAGAGVRVNAATRARLSVEKRTSRDAARSMSAAMPGFARPVYGTHQTSGFGPRWGRVHKGLDFAGPVGLPIRAVASGTVTIAEVQSGYGNVIEIQHADKSFTRYGHLSKIRVAPGDHVDAAQIIGALGNTGRSTGPHLHFEVRTPASVPFDPAPWLRARGIAPAEVKPSAPQD